MTTQLKIQYSLTSMFHFQGQAKRMAILPRMIVAGVFEPTVVTMVATTCPCHQNTVYTSVCACVYELFERTFLLGPECDRICCVFNNHLQFRTFTSEIR